MTGERKDENARKGNHYERWLAVLDALDVQFLVLDTERDRDLFQLVRSRPGWKLDVQDGESVLFARKAA